jgi:aminoglycoside phosphotransferase family enzyme/predicted kinase
MTAIDQTAVFAFLARPDAYGQPGETVTRMDTHASAIFLVGDEVYKAKKAVAFGYLDFTTLDSRRRNAEAEVAINRRTAPMLYQGVVAVTRDASGALALGGDGAPVEWLVRMRRFDQELLLSAIAQRGAFDAALGERLADAVFDFHAQAEPRPECGGAAELRRIVAGNDAELHRHAAARLTASAIDTLRERSISANDRNAPLLEARRQAGEVRRCHGDLHLRNICLIDGRPTLCDALEFDERLATIDVLYDLAFLLMDLDRRGLRAAASRLFNRYAVHFAPDALGRFADGLALLPLFLATRAAVRAHVTAAGGDADEAETYFRIANACLAPPGPRLIAVGGFSGSGKSTAALAIAPEIGPAPGALVLRTDAIRKAMSGVRPEDRLPAAAYTEAASREVYRVLNDTAARALRAGHSVVLDAVFGTAWERQEAAATAATAGVPFQAFWLDAPRDTMRARIAQRRGDVSDATVAVLESQLRMDVTAMEWPRIDAADGAEAVARRLMQSIA